STGLGTARKVHGAGSWSVSKRVDYQCLPSDFERGSPGARIDTPWGLMRSHSLQIQSETRQRSVSDCLRILIHERKDRFGMGVANVPALVVQNASTKKENAGGAERRRRKKNMRYCKVVSAAVTVL